MGEWGDGMEGIRVGGGRKKGRVKDGKKGREGLRLGRREGKG